MESLDFMQTTEERFQYKDKEMGFLEDRTIMSTEWTLIRIKKNKKNKKMNKNLFTLRDQETKDHKDKFKRRLNHQERDAIQVMQPYR